VLTGGTGADRLSGDAGNDTYVFARGDGQDLIVEWSGSGGWGGNDTLQFAAGIAPGDVTVTQASNGQDLVLSIAGGDSVTMRNAITNSDVRIEKVTFANGTVWSYADLFSRSLAGTSGSDTIYGGENADTLFGDSGNDVLIGRAGNDVLTGGTGNDQLSGDAGNDTYMFARGDGQDLIVEWSGSGGWGGIDTLQFAAGIDPSEITVTQANGGQNLVLSIAGGDSITMRNAITNGDMRIEQVSFANGVVWSYQDLLARSFAATAGDDTRYGAEGADTLSGEAGNDLLIGRAGNDVLTGGTGADRLSGDAGNDTYVFARGDGQDLIVEWSGSGGWGGNDTLQFAAGIDPSEITVTRANSGHDLVLSIAGGDSVTMRDAITNGDVRIEQVTFANGTVWSYQDLLDRSSDLGAAAMRTTNERAALLALWNVSPNAAAAMLVEAAAGFGIVGPSLLADRDNGMAHVSASELMASAEWSGASRHPAYQ
jgi:Ca2+-binding RTX toxin-like protein